MLEDQSEERACLHVLGLLSKEESEAFLREATENAALRTAAADLEEALANLTLSTTSIVRPSSDFKRKLLERIETEPARVQTDCHGNIRSINPAFTAICGYRIEELIGRKPGHVLQGPESDPASISILRASVQAGDACEVEMVNYHKNGSPYNVRIKICPLHDESGALVGFEGVEYKL